jgi:hypothetical protein
LFTNSGVPVREGLLEGVGALIFLKIDSVHEVITPLKVKDTTRQAALTYQENWKTTHGSHTRFDLIPWCRKLHAFDFPFFDSTWAPHAIFDLELVKAKNDHPSTTAHPPSDFANCPELWVFAPLQHLTNQILFP